MAQAAAPVAAAPASTAELLPMSSAAFTMPAPAAPLPQAVHTATLQAAPSTPAFATELTAQVRVMLQGEVHSARLELNPAELGPIRIDLNLQGGAADISFAAANSATREGIAHALPELRELFAQQGLQLGEAGVSAGSGQGTAQQQAQQQQQQDAAQQQAARNAAGARFPLAPAPGAAAPAAATVRISPARGALDLYA